MELAVGLDREAEIDNVPVANGIILALEAESPGRAAFG